MPKPCIVNMLMLSLWPVWGRVTDDGEELTGSE